MGAGVGQVIVGVDWPEPEADRRELPAEPGVTPQPLRRIPATTPMKTAAPRGNDARTATALLRADCGPRGEKAEFIKITVACTVSLKAFQESMICCSCCDCVRNRQRRVDAGGTTSPENAETHV